jgi:hypothetical protein
MIKAECRNCPSCKTSIFKIEGCDQMWCTQCNIAFSWKTGEIFKSTAAVHNPHYFEWMASVGLRNAQAQAPGGCDNNFGARFSNSLRRFFYNETVAFKSDLLIKIALVLADIEHGQIPYLNRLAIIPDSEIHRLNYLKGHITEDELKSIIYLNNKKSSKYTDIVNIYNMFVESVKSAIFQFLFSTNIIAHPPTPGYGFRSSTYDKLPNHNVSEFISCVKKIIDYTNISFTSIFKKYKTTSYYMCLNLYNELLNNMTVKYSWNYKIHSIKSDADYNKAVISFPNQLEYTTKDEITSTAIMYEKNK